jgi:ribonucleotide reductase alpha subunit
VDDRARDLGADGPVPEREIARLSYKFRTLGLGYANLGTYFMLRGIPYDSTRPSRSAAPSRRS